MIGMTEEPCPENYERDYVDYARRPRRVQQGDHMVLYAVGGSKRVFALAEVTSPVYNSGRERFPYRTDISYLINLPSSAGVHIDEISTPQRDLLKSLLRASYIELNQKEYEKAVSKLRKARSTRANHSLTQ
jgi:hypothetical protein